MTTKYFTRVETAKMIRTHLKRSFPTVKFSVRLDGDSVLVDWTDGATSKDVKAICNQYEGYTFDGMIDLASPIYQMLDIDGQKTRVSFGIRYVFTSRNHSPEFQQMLEDQLMERYGHKYSDRNYPTYWFQELADAVSFA